MDTIFNEQKIMKAFKSSVEGALKENTNSDVTKLMDAYREEVKRFFESDLECDEHGEIPLNELVEVYNQKTTGIFGNLNIIDFAIILKNNSVKLGICYNMDGIIFVVKVVVPGFKWKDKKSNHRVDLDF